MRNNLDGDVTKSYRMTTHIIFESVLHWLAPGSNDLSSLAAVLHINKSSAASNSKRLYTPDVVVTHHSN